MTSKGGGKDRSKQFDIHLDRNSTVGKIICDISSGCLSSRRSVENELDRLEKWICAWLILLLNQPPPSTYRFALRQRDSFIQVE